MPLSLYKKYIPQPVSRWRKIGRWLRAASPVASAIATLVIMGATIAYVSYSGRQWRTMRTELRTAKDAANAAQQSADAEVAANRAWMVPSGTKTWMVNKTYLAFEFDWINAGKTPAVHVRATEEFKTDPNATFKEGCISFNPMKGGQAEQMTPFLLAQQPFSIIPILPIQDRAWVEGTAQQIAVHGCIRYVDVLTSHDRSTEFCFLVRQQAMLRGEHIELCSGLEFGVSPFSKEFETWEPIIFK